MDFVNAWFSALLFSVLFAGLVACQRAEDPYAKPEAFAFGATKAEVKALLAGSCNIVADREMEEIELPTARHSQSQIDAQGFEYGGKKRKIELVFADDTLDLVWVLTEAEEEATILEAFKARFGEPTHESPDAVFFLNDGVALRSDPHEVLFISDRLREPWRNWLEAQ